MKSTTYFPNLTPLRGIAALLTVIFHIGIYIGPLVDVFRVGGIGPLLGHSMLLNHMYLMVDFFFILSGFIMCHVYGHIFAGSVNQFSLKKFAVARFARVYPLHFITLFYTVILFAVSGRLGVPQMRVMQVANNNYSILTNVFLLHSMNFHNWFTWNHASWSISTEWWAYMIFPFLVRPFMKLKSRGKILIALLCFVGYCGIMLFVVPITTTPEELHFGKGSYKDYSLNVSYQFGYLRCLCGFVLGMITYQCYLAGWGKKILANGYVMLAATLALFTSMHFGWPDVISVGFLPFILLSGAYGSKAINNLFAKKAMQRLGDWSFSIYLVHQPLLFTFGNIYTYFNPAEQQDHLTGSPANHGMLTGWIICLGLIACILLVSSFTYRFWELPARRWINSKATLNSNVEFGLRQS